ncbi:hypothetical protein V7x_13350 [Crateriforma conspicua]|uniref:Uncharacterized protein n=1 Tax=Crateriforma conspicua TaxID=2527996 RepID=A0A5C6FRI6_9PLAN|nr:hypothetical protein V7x_13350 [Crateriforma conspicua]
MIASGGAAGCGASEYGPVLSVPWEHPFGRIPSGALGDLVAVSCRFFLQRHPCRPSVPNVKKDQLRRLKAAQKRRAKRQVADDHPIAARRSQRDRPDPVEQAYGRLVETVLGWAETVSGRGRHDVSAASRCFLKFSEPREPTAAELLRRIDALSSGKDVTERHLRVAVQRLLELASEYESAEQNDAALLDYLRMISQ